MARRDAVPSTWELSPPSTARHEPAPKIEEMSIQDLERRVVELQNSIAASIRPSKRAIPVLDLSPVRNEGENDNRRVTGHATSNAFN